MPAIEKTKRRRRTRDKLCAATEIIVAALRDLPKEARDRVIDAACGLLREPEKREGEV